MNKIYNESFKIIGRMTEVYKQYFEDMQRMNQQWLSLFWRPFMGQQQQQEEKDKKE